ncbi:MAG TPA: hypothetical protein PKD55_00170 [Bellilinea sp.]|nr:hypothetical protein [Bellilinea sp.]
MPPVYIYFKPIVLAPQDTPEWRFRGMERDLLRVIGVKVANTIKKDMEKFQTKWDHKVQIRIKPALTARQFRVDITPFGTNKKYWGLVTSGVPGRYIARRRAPYLSIKKGYRPHTTPKGGSGGPGTYSGPFYRARYPVWWPGYEGREFERYIVSKREKYVVKEIMRTVQRWFPGS